MCIICIHNDNSVDSNLSISTSLRLFFLNVLLSVSVKVMASCFSPGKVEENLRFIEQIGLRDMYTTENQSQLLSQTLFPVSVTLIYVS